MDSEQEGPAKLNSFHDIASAYNKKGSQIDIAVSDFSKAFDTVPHDGLLSKLKHYGIDDKIWKWISNFLKRVVVDGIQSRPGTIHLTHDSIRLLYLQFDSISYNSIIFFLISE